MRLLLDSHALLWWSLNDDRLGKTAATALVEETNDVFVSAASAWEITTKHRLGKLPSAAALAADMAGYLREEDFRPLSVTILHAARAGRLAIDHKDPFDRLLIAQAIMEKLVLVSNEARFDAFGVSRLW